MSSLPQTHSVLMKILISEWAFIRIIINGIFLVSFFKKKAIMNFNFMFIKLVDVI